MYYTLAPLVAQHKAVMFTFISLTVILHLHYHKELLVQALVMLATNMVTLFRLAQMVPGYLLELLAPEMYMYITAMQTVTTHCLILLLVTTMYRQLMR